MADDDRLADLQVIINHVRAGGWLQPGRSLNFAIAFVAGYLAARPSASVAEVADALRVAEIDASMVHAAHTTIA